MQATMTRAYRGREDKMVFYAISLSLALHIVFFVLFVILPEFSGQRYVPPKTIDVMILPGGGGSPAPVAEQPQGASPAANTSAPAEKQPASSKPVTPVEAVYIPPAPTETPSQYTTIKPEDATTPKPEKPPEVVTPVVESATTDNVKTFAPQSSKPSDATKKVEQALAQMQQATQRSDSAVQETQGSRESVNSAIEQLRQKANENTATGTGGSGTGTGGGHGSGTGTGTGSGSGAGVGTPLTEYLVLVQAAFEKNWSFSQAMFNGSPNMEVILEATVLANGEITDIKYVKKSGNVYLDESAYKAVAKSNRLPPFTVTNLKMAQFKYQFRFTPKGLARR